MTILGKYYFLWFTGFFLLFFSIIILFNLENTNIGATIFICLYILYLVLMWTIKCPKCKTSVMSSDFALSKHYKWKLFYSRKYCVNCKFDLDFDLDDQNNILVESSLSKMEDFSDIPKPGKIGDEYVIIAVTAVRAGPEKKGYIKNILNIGDKVYFKKEFGEKWFYIYSNDPNIEGWCYSGHLKKV